MAMGRNLRVAAAAVLGFQQVLGRLVRGAENLLVSKSKKLTHLSATKCPDIPALNRHHSSNHFRSTNPNSQELSLDIIACLAQANLSRES
jgi:hypothetical protein